MLAALRLSYPKKGPAVNDWVRDLQWNGIVYGVVAASALLALLGMWLFVPALRRRWFPLPRLRPGTWSGFEVFFAGCVFVGFGGMIVDLLNQMGFFGPLIGPEPKASRLERAVYSLRCSYITSPLTFTVIMGLLFAMMFARTRSRPHHYGLSWSRWQVNLALGIAAFVLAWPVIIGIHALMFHIFTMMFHIFTKQEDPLELLGKQNLPRWEWLLFAFHTTVASPVLEEILFRGILQGWLRRASLVGHVAILLVMIAVVSQNLVLYDTEAETFSYNWDQTVPMLLTLLAAAGYGYVMFRLARDFGLNEAELRPWQPLPSELPLHPVGQSDDQVGEMRKQILLGDVERSQRWAEANANLAIFGSALLFAVAHPWPNAIALFVMGLVLGWLSRRTQSLIGPITFHALFNLTTFIVFYGSVLTAPEQNGNAQTTAARPSVAGSIATSVPASQLPLRK
jgi:membrane protease YdiL (CAAX protease family)